MVEKALIDRCLNEDQLAQTELYKRCYTLFIGTCWRYARQRDQAIDYMNQAFVRILMNLKKYDTNLPFEAWAKRVVINTIINEFKKQKNFSTNVSLVDDTSLHFISTEDDAELNKQELLNSIYSKIDQLPNMTAKVFNLYAVDGYKHHEIAAMLGISEGTSMWHYSDAKRRIREMLGVPVKQ